MATKKKKTEVVSTEDNILLEQENKNIKKELEEYVDEKVNKVFIEELDKANRRLLREKNRKIVFKNIAIVILLAIIGFLVYLLYTNSYFDRFFNKENNNNNIVEKEKEQEEKKEEVKKEPTLDELKKEYGYLLDKYVLDDKSEYLEDFYNGNLTSNIKKYLTLNTIDFSSIKTEDDYQIFSNDAFRLAYEKLFDNSYDATNFDYNGNKIRYVSMMNSYMTTTLLTKGSALEREISNIKVNDDSIMITTVEGVVRDSKLYNILTNTEIEGYDETSLLKYSDSLNKITYVFKNNKLVDLVK